MTVLNSVAASVKITCTAFVDDKLHSVYYGDTKLDVAGDTTKAEKMKTFAFETNQKLLLIIERTVCLSFFFNMWPF